MVIPAIAWVLRPEPPGPGAWDGLVDSVVASGLGVEDLPPPKPLLDALLAAPDAEGCVAFFSQLTERRRRGAIVGAYSDGARAFVGAAVCGELGAALPQDQRRALKARLEAIESTLPERLDVLRLTLLDVLVHATRGDVPQTVRDRLPWVDDAVCASTGSEDLGPVGLTRRAMVASVRREWADEVLRLRPSLEAAWAAPTEDEVRSLSAAIELPKPARARALEAEQLGRGIPVSYWARPPTMTQVDRALRTSAVPLAAVLAALEACDGGAVRVDPRNGVPWTVVDGALIVPPTRDADRPWFVRGLTVPLACAGHGSTP